MNDPVRPAALTAMKGAGLMASPPTPRRVRMVCPRYSGVQSPRWALPLCSAQPGLELEGKFGQIVPGPDLDPPLRSDHGPRPPQPSDPDRHRPARGRPG